jgi:hypothetical protein
MLLFHQYNEDICEAFWQTLYRLTRETALRLWFARLAT